MRITWVYWWKNSSSSKAFLRKAFRPLLAVSRSMLCRPCTPRSSVTTAMMVKSALLLTWFAVIIRLCASNPYITLGAGSCTTVVMHRPVSSGTRTNGNCWWSFFSKEQWRMCLLGMPTVVLMRRSSSCSYWSKRDQSLRTQLLIGCGIRTKVFHLNALLSFHAHRWVMLHCRNMWHCIH